TGLLLLRAGRAGRLGLPLTLPPRDHPDEHDDQDARDDHREQEQDRGVDGCSLPEAGSGTTAAALKSPPDACGLERLLTYGLCSGTLSRRSVPVTFLEWRAGSRWSELPPQLRRGSRGRHRPKEEPRR